MRSKNTIVWVVALGAAAAGCGGGSKNGRRELGIGAVRSGAPTTVAMAPRAEHTATLLASGEVLVAGGVDAGGNAVASTLLVSVSGVRSGPDLATPRVGHTATALADGKVLIAGGASDPSGRSALATSEVFDPLTETFSPGPGLAQARAWHVAARSGASVVLAGGRSGMNDAGPVLLAQAELLDPAAGTSTALASGLATPQADAQAAALDGGVILVAGGQGAQGPVAADVFDPATQRFAPARGAVIPRAGAAVVARGGEALVAGGQSATGIEASTDAFDVATRTLAHGVKLGGARRDAAVALVGGDVLVVGGKDAAGVVTHVEALSGPALGQARVAALAPLKWARRGATVTAIDATRALVIGGVDAQGVVVGPVELIDTAAPAAPPPAIAAGLPAAGVQATRSGLLGPAAMPAAYAGPLPPKPATPVATPAATPTPTPVAPAPAAAPAPLPSAPSGLSGLLSSLLGGAPAPGAASPAGGLGSLLGSLLGGLTGTSGATTSPFGSLFGAPTASPTPSPAASPLSSLLSLFGLGSPTPTATPFGAPAAPAGTSSPLGSLLSLFGLGSPAPAASPFGGSPFGGSPFGFSDPFGFGGGFFDDD